MKKEPNIKIFVSHHKTGYLYKDDIFIPVQVGKSISKVDLGIQGDDVGDNISDKNTSYAELTTQYRVWKNYDLSDVDYIGFCHYRRYLDFRHKIKISKMIQIFKNTEGRYKSCCNVFDYVVGFRENFNCFSEHLISNFSKYIKKYFSKHSSNICLGKRPFAIRMKKNPKLQLKNNGLWESLKRIILDKYPEYEKSLQEIQCLKRRDYCNIFIMDKKTFFKYSERIFSILFELEKEIKKNSRESICLNEPMTAGTRFIGCLTERLQNLFVLHEQRNGLKVSRKATQVFIEGPKIEKK